MKINSSILIFLLIFIKGGLVAFASTTIGTHQTLILSIFLDIIFLGMYFANLKNLVYTYYYVGIFCIALYISYYISDGNFFTMGGDDQIYYDNFLFRINNCHFGYSCDEIARSDLATKILLVLSNPFRNLGLDFLSPVDYFLLQSACLSALGPLILRLSGKVFANKVCLIYFFAFTPYWYYGIVGREWPLYYIAIIISLVCLSNYPIWIKQGIVLILLYIVFLVRLESGIIFSIFLLSQLNRKACLYVIILIIMGSLLYIDELGNWIDYAISKRDDIYFAKSEYSSGLGGLLKYSESFLLKPIFFLYLIISPFPPFFFHIASFENLMLLVGQLLWPILILAMLIQKKIFFITLKEFPILKGAFYTFLFVIFLLTFFGGTHRHYYPFIPNLLLILPLMLANRNKSWISFAKIPMILITSLLILYLVVKTFL